MAELSDFRVPSDGTLSDCRLETEKSPMGLTEDSLQKSETEPFLDARKPPLLLWPESTCVRLRLMFDNAMFSFTASFFLYTSM